MCLILFIFFCLFLSGNGKQSLYKLTLEHGKVSYFNPKYVDILYWSFKKYNRTSGAFNFIFTFKTDVDDSFTDHVSGLLFKNNEFKKTAIDFDLKICTLLEQLHNFDVGHVLENSNLTLQCPIKKGTYYAYDIIPDAENFPPLMPAGKWLFKQEFKLRGIHITTLDFIWTIEYS